MSYPRDLDEIPEAELRDELANRARNRADGLCDYCCRPPASPPCRFPERHAMAAKPADTNALPDGFVLSTEPNAMCRGKGPDHCRKGNSCRRHNACVYFGGSNV